MFVKTQEKTLIKQLIRATYNNKKEVIYPKLEKALGNNLARKLDEEIFMSFYNDTLCNKVKRTRYIDVLENISNNFDLIFDVDFENMDNCYFSDNGSIYSEEDRKIIYEG